MVFWLFFITSTIFLSIILSLHSLITKPANKFGYFLVAFFSKILLLISSIPVEISGKENVGEEQAKRGLIIAANHSSFLDFFVLQANLPAGVKFVVWGKGFNMPFLKSIYKNLDYIGVGRREDVVSSSLKLYNALKQGDKLVIFSKPAMQKETDFQFDENIVRLSETSKTEILPIAIRNSQGVLPFSKFLLNPGKVEVIIGTPRFFPSVEELRNVILELRQAPLE